MDNTGKWTWASEYADRWENELCNTREQAIKAGKADGLERFEIGRCQPHQLPSFNAFFVLNRIEDDFEDEATPEAAYDWRKFISGNDEKLLEKMLNEALEKWQDITNNRPKSYAIVDIEKITVDKGETKR